MYHNARRILLIFSTNVDPAATYAWDFDNNGTVEPPPTERFAPLYHPRGLSVQAEDHRINFACVDSIIKTVSFPFVHLQNDTTIYTDQSIVLDAGERVMPICGIQGRQRRRSPSMVRL